MAFTLGQNKKFGINAVLPTALYRVGIKKAEAGISKRTQNPMITLTCEFLAPESVTQDGVEHVIAGVEFTHWLVFVEKALGNVEHFLTCLGWDPTVPFDADKETAAILEGKAFDAVVAFKAQERRKPQTPEQKRANKPGDAITDAFGKPIISGYDAFILEVPDNARPEQYRSNTPY